MDNPGGGRPPWRDLAASLGHLGQQEHPEVVAAVEGAITTVIRLGKPAGADVTILARGSERLAETKIGT